MTSSTANIKARANLNRTMTKNTINIKARDAIKRKIIRNALNRTLHTNC